MGEPLVLTFDIGTQSSRAVLVDRSGNIIMKKQKKYDPPYFSTQANWAEQKPDYYYNCICECSRELKTSGRRKMGRHHSRHGNSDPRYSRMCR
jgi:sugar (pentulose or hexulose) kinase